MAISKKSKKNNLGFGLYLEVSNRKISVLFMNDGIDMLKSVGNEPSVSSSEICCARLFPASFINAPGALHPSVHWFIEGRHA